jgi:hypothetical protein
MLKKELKLWGSVQDSAIIVMKALDNWAITVDMDYRGNAADFSRLNAQSYYIGYSIH